MADTNLNAFLQTLMERLDERSTDPYSESLLKDIAESIQLQTSILKDQVVKDNEMISIQKAFKNAISEMGIKTSTEFKGSLSSVIDTIKSSIRERGSQYTLEDISKVLANLLATKMAVALKMENRGEAGAPLTGVASQKTETYLKEISEHMGADVVALNSLQERFIRFIGWNKEDSEKTRKERRAYGYQLLDALEKSKFIGGALRDTVRLVGLIGARWLSQFGPVGRFVGGIFYALSEVLGPFIVQGIVRGVGALLGRFIPLLLTGLGNGLKGIGGALLGVAVRGQGALMGFSQWGNLTPYGKALTVGRTAGALGAATIGFTGAKLAFGQMKDSWQQGRKGNATAFGVGGAFLGAGGIAAIAALFTAAAAPLIAPLLAIGAGVAGLALIWKNFGGKITNWLGAHKEIIGKIAEVIFPLYGVFKSIQRAVDWVKEHFGGGDKSGEKDPNSSVNGIFGIGGKGASTSLLKGKTDSTGHLSLSKMSEEDWKKADTLDPVYGSLGQILNLGSMSQKRAAEVIRADIAKKGNKSYYEIGDKSLVDKSQFLTDAADKDNVYFVRGTNDRVRGDLAKLAAAGFDVSNAKITAGIGTLGSRERMSPHSYGGSTSGHFSSTSSVDISGIYRNGRRALFGEYSKYLPMYFGQSESDHEHWAYGKFQWMKDMEEEMKVASERAKAVQSMQNMMSVTGVISNLPPEQKKEFAERMEADMKKSKDGTVDTEKLLKELFGIYRSDSMKGSPWVINDPNTGSAALLYDPTANDKFSETAIQLLANGGT